MIVVLSCVLILAGKGLLSQTTLDSNDRHKVIINYPHSPNVDAYSFQALVNFKYEADLISGVDMSIEGSDTVFLKVGYNPVSLKGSFTRYNNKKVFSTANFMLSQIKEKRNGDSLSYYRDILQEGIWTFNHSDTNLMTKSIFDKGEQISWGIYKSDTLVEGGHYKRGLPVGEWLQRRTECSYKHYYDYKGNVIYAQAISLSGGKIMREWFRELFEKTTRLDDCGDVVEFWYIVKYNEQGTVSTSGHYIYSITGASTDSWDYIPYGVHDVYENGKITKKRYPKMPTEIKYSSYRFGADGREYKTDYVKKLN